MLINCSFVEHFMRHAKHLFVIFLALDEYLIFQFHFAANWERVCERGGLRLGTPVWPFHYQLSQHCRYQLDYPYMWLVATTPCSCPPLLSPCLECVIRRWLMAFQCRNLPRAAATVYQQQRKWQRQLTCLKVCNAARVLTHLICFMTSSARTLFACRYGL